jgi:formate dehydrogenase maturation protein FdhE
MLTFIQFLEELSKDHVTLSPAEVQRMRDRFGDKALQMGHLQEDGSMSIPVDSIVEAVQSLGSQKLNEAVENLKNEEMVAMLESAETLVERVAEAQKRKLAQMVDRFQSEPDADKAHQQWKQIEKMIFGVDYPD